jgi:diaminopimelate epimerase
MAIPFTKASACGNDFLIIESQHAPDDERGFTRRICDRHNGVGADGVEWLSTPIGHAADGVIRLINADGSLAEISGNGTRCVAAYMVAQGAGEGLRISTGAGVKQLRLISRQGNSFQFEGEMGRPKVGEPFSLKIGPGLVHGTPLSMGNPHYVVFVERFPEAWQAQAEEIQQQESFREGVNVEFVRIAGPDAIEVRFFERGVGETQSSGTGSCASAVAAITWGKARSPLTVNAPGGAQTVRWEGGDVYLIGPAQIVCRGEFFG